MAHLHIAIVSNVVALHQLVAIGLEEKHFPVEGGREEGERAAAAVVHTENREVVRPVTAVEVGEVGSNSGQDLPPCLRGFMKGRSEELRTYLSKE